MTRFPARIDVPCVLFIAAVVAFHLYLYLTYPAVPWHSPTRGWEGWFDQGWYLKSARAFAAFDLSADNHLYPIGYSLLGAAFVPFFDDPFFIPDLLCVVVFAWMFQRYFRPLIGIAGVALAFFAALAFPFTTQIPFDVWHILWLQFVVPWNTIPIATLFMSLLCAIRDLRTDSTLSRHFLVGAMAGAVAAIKPAELLPLTVLGLWYVIVTFRNRTAALRGIGTAALGCVVVAGPLLALTVSIHHGLSSSYTDTIKYIGMSLSDLPQRAVDLFIDAGPSYGEPNAALLGLLPWLPILGPLALVGATLRWRELLAPVALVVASFLTYLAYNDFGPTNVLHFFLIHYVVWTFPVIAACGLCMAVSIVQRPVSAIPCIVAILCFCTIGALRVELKLAYSHVESRTVPGGSAFNLTFSEKTHLDAIDLPANKALVEAPNVGNPLRLDVDGEPLRTFTGYRLLNLPGRLRVMFMRPVDATLVSFWIPGVVAGEAVDIRPLRFSLRWASSPWEKHSGNLNVTDQ